MAAFFAVAAVTIPAICLLESKKNSGDLKKVEAATSLHFRIVYLGLLGLGAVVVGTSVLELFAEEHPTSGHQQHVHTNTKREWWKAVFIVLMWFGPISSMLCLPRKSVEEGNEEEIAPVIPKQKKGKKR
eukprot:8221887-Ditylum_brightwellii.AAC.1